MAATQLTVITYTGKGKLCQAKAIRAPDGTPYVLAQDALYKGNSATPTSFSKMDDTNRPWSSLTTETPAVDICVRSDGDFEIAYFDASGKDQTWYTVTFDISAGTFGTEASIHVLNDELSLGSELYQNQKPITHMSCDSNGRIHLVLYDGYTSMGTTYPQAHYKTYTDSDKDDAAVLITDSASYTRNQYVYSLAYTSGHVPYFICDINNTVGIRKGNANPPTSFSTHTPSNGVNKTGSIHLDGSTVYLGRPDTADKQFKVFEGSSNSWADTAYTNSLSSGAILGAGSILANGHIYQLGYPDADEIVINKFKISDKTFPDTFTGSGKPFSGTTWEECKTVKVDPYGYMYNKDGNRIGGTNTNDPTDWIWTWNDVNPTGDSYLYYVQYDLPTGETGYSKEVNSVATYSEINGVAVANISEFNGV